MYNRDEAPTFVGTETATEWVGACDCLLAARYPLMLILMSNFNFRVAHARIGGDGIVQIFFQQTRDEKTNEYG